jgi:hypothetical protein
MQCSSLHTSWSASKSLHAPCDCRSAAATGSVLVCTAGPWTPLCGLAEAPKVEALVHESLKSAMRAAAARSGADDEECNKEDSPAKMPPHNATKAPEQ